MYGTEPRLIGGRYEIGPVLGYGGMAEVYRGRDVRLGREVAVKTLRADLARDPTFHTRFRREAQSSAALNHPAIVSVYDTGEDEVDGVTVPYIVMEYIEGRTLREVLTTEGPFTEVRALEITSDVCAALDYSHRMGIIHRDIKPANVMLCLDGSIKVMDFGIARATTATSSMTQTAQVIGTAQYLSPEQARGETVDARSDVYSTGVLLYELLTGNPPFRGDSPVAVAYQHVREAPQPPSVHDPDISPEADAIVFKSMAKAREDRYQSAGEMRDDCERALAGRPVYAPLLAAGGATQMLGGTGATQRIAPGGYGDPTSNYGRGGYDDDYYGPPTGQIGQPGGPGGADGRSGWWKYAAVIGAVVVVFIIAALLAKSALGGGGGGSKATIPNDIVGQNFAGATTELENLGLKVKVTSANNDTVDKDRIISVNPDEGQSVKKGSLVTLVKSLGKGQIPVPSLVNLTQSAAEQQLQAAGLTPIVQQVPLTPGATAGNVVSQDPKPGQKVEKGDSVTINVASDKGNLPNVVGQDYNAAAAALGGLGYQVQRQDVDSTSQAPGKVIAQNPPAGQAALGTTVTLQVARTPQPTQTPTPTPTDDTTDPTPTPSASATTGLGGVGGGIPGPGLGN